MNEYKFSALRQFGSENVSFTSTISKEDMLDEADIEQQAALIDKFISKAFRKSQDREIAEKALLAEYSDRRKEEVVRLDKALQEEMDAKTQAQQTMGKAGRLDKALKIVEAEEKKANKK